MKRAYEMAFAGTGSSVTQMVAAVAGHQRQFRAEALVDEELGH